MTRATPSARLYMSPPSCLPFGPSGSLSLRCFSFALEVAERTIVAFANYSSRLPSFLHPLPPSLSPPLSSCPFHPITPPPPLHITSPSPLPTHLATLRFHSYIHICTHAHWTAPRNSAGLPMHDPPPLPPSIPTSLAPRHYHVFTH